MRRFPDAAGRPTHSGVTLVTQAMPANSFRRVPGCIAAPSRILTRLCPHMRDARYPGLCGLTRASHFNTASDRVSHALSSPKRAETSRRSIAAQNAPGVGRADGLHATRSGCESPGGSGVTALPMPEFLGSRPRRKSDAATTPHFIDIALPVPQDCHRVRRPRRYENTVEEVHDSVSATAASEETLLVIRVRRSDHAMDEVAGTDPDAAIRSRSGR